MGRYSVTLGYIEHEAGVCRDFGTYATLTDAFGAVPRAERMFGHQADLTISVRLDHRVIWSIAYQGCQDSEESTATEYSSPELIEHKRSVFKAAA